MSKSKRIFLMIGIFISLITFLHWQNNGIQTTFYQLDYKNLPKAFDNYKILHISDLHNKSFGKNQKNLIKKIKDLNPDIIVITGDTLSRYNDNKEKSFALIEQLVNVAPIYFVTGNHEAYVSGYDEFEAFLIDKQVTVLRNESVSISRDEEEITIIGLDDPKFSYEEEFCGYLSELGEAHLNEFTMLLSHRPNFLDDFSAAEIDLTFSGHVHGGQIRLPFIGGIFSPDQGLFPEYDAGIYKAENGSTVVISRGLGASFIPQRLFNRPELIMVTLKNRSPFSTGSDN